VINALLPTMDRIAAEVGQQGCRAALVVLDEIIAALGDLITDPS